MPSGEAQLAAVQSEHKPQLPINSNQGTLQYDSLTILRSREREDSPPQKRRRTMQVMANVQSSFNSDSVPTILVGTEVTRCALYIFAGLKRRSSIGSLLQKAGWKVCELDIMRSRDHDLTRPSTRSQILDQIDAGKFGLVISSPPCNTFSRVKFANSFGPSPSRDCDHLRGFPWASPSMQKQNRLGNILVDFSYAAVLHQALRPGPNNMIIKEHPEDMGVVIRGPHKGKTPASIWRFPQFEKCIEAGCVSVGLRQNDFGMPYPKPTRLLLKLYGQLPDTFFKGRPEFDASGVYTGPIPRSTTHTATLAKNSPTESFRTTGTAAWPPLLCQQLSNLVIAAEGAFNLMTSGNCDNLDSDFKLLQDEENDEAERSIVTGNDTSFPINLPPEGYLKGGTGSHRVISSLGKLYPFRDGAGLCSPGNWDKGQRNFPQGKRWQELRSNISDVIFGTADELGRLKMFASLCCGKESAFVPGCIDRLRETIHVWLGRQAGDYHVGSQPHIEQGQPFYLRLIYHILREGGDPDYAVISEYEKGVNLGVTEPLPHTPAVFELQTTWRLRDEPWDNLEWHNPNYTSLKEHKEQVRSQFEEEIKEHLMDKCTLSELKAAYPNGYAISALAVLQEKEKIRVLHDGTHVTGINKKIKTRDKLRTPGPREKAHLLNGYRDRGRFGVSLLGDVGKAHRRVKVRREDWAWQACSLDDCRSESDVVYLNKVGTFGIGSAAYWWGRLGAILIRMTYMLLGGDHSLDILLYADDVEFIAETPAERSSIVMAVAILLAVGTPFKWSKFRGGYELQWVGYTFSHKLYAVGISQERTDWVTGWIKKLLQEGAVLVADFIAGLGRLNFAASALVYEKPFLGLLYVWSAALQRTHLQLARLPWAVRIVLHWISSRLMQEYGRLQNAVSIARPLNHRHHIELFRADAKATEQGAWIGGWEYKGGLPSNQARWFAYEVDRNVFPWLFSKKDPKRVIAGLELLATILCIILFGVEGDYEGGMYGSTDNQGNTYAVSKLMSTKFPLTILLMEMSEQLRSRNAVLGLSWLPRESNTEADDLTNGKFDRFDAALRVDITSEILDQFKVLPSIQTVSQDLYNAIVKEKENKKGKPTEEVFVRKKLSIKERLKWREPW